MNNYRYLATFISGLQVPVESVLKNTLKDCRIVLLLDGAVVFETSYSYDRLGMHCFNNIFALIDTMKAKNDSSIEIFMQDILRRKLSSEVILSNIKKIKTFRIIASAENQLVSVNESIKSSFERFIGQQSKLILNRSKSDTEFWFLYRNEGYCFFMKRLSKHMAYDKLLHKGELHPELAYLLNYLSCPTKNDVCLDPFCGYGSIPYQRLYRFPTNMVYAFDIDATAINIKRKKISADLLPRLIIKKVDVRNIGNELSSESIDRIVTDPPWGFHEKIEEGIQQFYNTFLESLEKLLKNNGRMIILSAKKEECEKAISGLKNLRIEDVYNILVSGKKSSIYCIIKESK